MGEGGRQGQSGHCAAEARVALRPVQLVRPRLGQLPSCAVSHCVFSSGQRHHGRAWEGEDSEEEGVRAVAVLRARPLGGRGWTSF